LREQSVSGRFHFEVFPNIPERWKESHWRRMAGEAVRGEQDAFPSADGSAQRVNWEMRPWFTSDQAIGGIAIFAEDATEEVEAVQALRKAGGHGRLKREELETILAAIPAPAPIANDAACLEMAGNLAADRFANLPVGVNPGALDGVLVLGKRYVRHERARSVISSLSLP
jgi:hypothetical protein